MTGAGRGTGTRGTALASTPAPVGLARHVCFVTLAVVPFVFVALAGVIAFGTRPADGFAYVRFAADPVSAATSSALEVATVDAKVSDAQVLSGYYLVNDLAHLTVMIVVVIAGLVAWTSLQRRPLSPLLVWLLGVLSAFSAWAFVAGPAARNAAKARAADLLDLPSTAAAARDAGQDVVVRLGADEWYAWHGVYGTITVVALAAALFVGHLRRVTARPATPTRKPAARPTTARKPVATATRSTPRRPAPKPKSRPVGR